MTVTDTFTIDGINDVTYKSGDGSSTSTRSFDSGFLGYLSQYISGDDLDSTVTLTGSDWTIAALRFGAEDGNHVTLTDSDADTGRGINYLKLGNSSDVTLISTRVDYIVGDDGGDHDITLGSANTRSVNLYGDLNTVKTGSGYVGAIDTDNDSNIKVNGDVGSILTQDDDVLTINSGYVEFAKLRGGTDDVKVKDGATIHSLKSNGDGSTTTVTVRDGGRVDYYDASGQDVVIVMEGSGRVREIDTYLGVNDITTADSWITSFNSWESENTINIGTGGIGSMTMGSESSLHHTITADGYVQLLSIYETDTVDLTINDSAGAIYLGDGDDEVQTGEGYFDYLGLGDGNDEANIGAGGGGQIAAGDGDDVIKVSATANALYVNGGSGVDTLDFSSFTTGVKFSLDEAGQYQNVSSPNDINNNVAGYFSEVGVENIIGGKKRDHLQGDAGDNYLKGRGGKDILRGGEGNDTLRGDGAKDTFVFGDNGGTDTIEDFDIGTDIIKIKDHVGGFGGLSISNSGGDLEVVYDGGTILLQGMAGEVLSGSDFVFV